MNICITRAIPGVAAELLKNEGYAVNVNPHDRPLTKEELRRFVEGADAILSLLTDTMDGEVMDAAGPQLKIIANYAVGYDNIDTSAANKRGVAVTNTPDVLTESVAEHTFALMLTLSRRIIEADAFTRAGKYQGWEPMLFLGTGLKGKTLGIIGLGRIGFSVAKKAAKGMDMEILYTDTKRNEEFEREFGATFATQHELLKRADVVTLHVPLVPSTRHLIGKNELASMKRSALLINTARGPVIDEHALVDALRNGVIAGAALDVFEDEPHLAPGLAKLANVVLTPHIASATHETRNAMARMAAENIIEALAGKTPTNMIM